MEDEYKEESEETNLYEELTETEDEIPETEEESEETNLEEEGEEEEAEEQTDAFYNAEELKELSKKGEHIDPDRLPDELRGLHKQLLGDYTRKTQDLSEALKGLQQPQKRSYETPEQAIQAGDLDFAYDSMQKEIDNAEDFIENLDDQIQDARDEFDTDKIPQLRAQKKQVKAYQKDIKKKMTALQRNVQYAQQQIEPEVFNNSAEILKAVKEETGVDFSLNELAAIAADNPTVAAKVGKILAARHKQRSARDSALKKEKKKKPNQLLSSNRQPGRGGGKPMTSKEKKLHQLYLRAQKTGSMEDEMAYLNAKLQG